MTTRRAVLVLGALEAFPPISMDLYVPELPRLADDLHTSVSLAQATMSACMMGLALGQLVSGPLSDRFGRRRPLLAGTALFAVFSLLCALAPNVEILLMTRFLQGATGSAGIVVGLAVARDLAEGRELARLLSLLGLVGALAPILAPVAGGQLAADAPASRCVRHAEINDVYRPSRRSNAPFSAFKVPRCSRTSARIELVRRSERVHAATTEEVQP